MQFKQIVLYINQQPHGALFPSLSFSFPSPLPHPMIVLINKNSACSWKNKVCTNHQHKSHKDWPQFRRVLTSVETSFPCVFTDCKTLEIGPPLVSFGLFYTHTHTHTHTNTLTQMQSPSHLSLNIGGFLRYLMRIFILWELFFKWRLYCSL